MPRFALGRAPTRLATPQLLGEVPQALGAPGQRFHNVRPNGDMGDVGGNSFFSQEGDSKGAILLGDVASLLGHLPARTSLGAAATVVNVAPGNAGGASYKDYTTSDGYTFRRYVNDDGDIYIVKSPISKKETILTATDPKTKTAWAHVDALIRATDSGQKPAGIDPTILVAAIKGGAAVSVALLHVAGGKKAKKKKKKKAAEAEVVVAPPEASTIPWVPIAFAGGGLLLVFMLMGSRKAAA